MSDIPLRPKLLIEHIVRKNRCIRELKACMPCTCLVLLVNIPATETLVRPNQAASTSHTPHRAPSRRKKYTAVVQTHLCCSKDFVDSVGLQGINHQRGDLTRLINLFFSSTRVWLPERQFVCFQAQPSVTVLNLQS